MCVCEYVCIYVMCNEWSVNKPSKLQHENVSDFSQHWQKPKKKKPTTKTKNQHQTHTHTLFHFHIYK